MCRGFNLLFSLDDPEAVHLGRFVKGKPASVALDVDIQSRHNFSAKIMLGVDLKFTGRHKFHLPSEVFKGYFPFGHGNRKGHFVKDSIRTLDTTNDMNKFVHTIPSSEKSIYMNYFSHIQKSRYYPD